LRGCLSGDLIIEEPNGLRSVSAYWGRALMSPTDYRRKAEECLRLADRVSPKTRAVLITMAECWLRLAQHREDSVIEREVGPKAPVI
jgi:hypothetical protein